MIKYINFVYKIYTKIILWIYTIKLKISFVILIDLVYININIVYINIQKSIAWT